MTVNCPSIDETHALSWTNAPADGTVGAPFTPGSHGINTMSSVSTAGPDLSTLLPGYALERELGRGAMGIVYLARHESLGRLVAVKELQGALACDPATRSRFVVEAKVLASMDHPHVVPVYDFIERDDRCALVMEQLPGGTVWDRFVSDGYSMPHATAITLATCSAMQHAHDGGVLHRDIKPENLMFDATGFMKVTDFGIARVVNGPSTKATIAGTVLGTPAYMAPEQAEGKEVGATADVYATATMFYEMLSGRLPFDRAESLTGMLTQRILSDPTPLSEVAPHVPTELADAAMRGLARDPGDRTQSADLLGREIAEAAARSWGAEWLDASPVMVAGSDSIERAARTTAGKSATPNDARSTMLPGAVNPPHSGASETILPGSTDAPDLGDDTPVGGSDPPATPEKAAPERKVKPRPSDRDVGRAQSDQIDQLIDISEVLKAPPRPVAQALLAAAFLMAALAWAWFGNTLPGTSVDYLDDRERPGLAINGETFDLQPFDLDLTEPIIVSGVQAGEIVSIDVTQLGAPVGATDSQAAGSDGTAVLDTGFVGRVTSGAFDGTVSIGDGTTASSETSFDATATNPWFLTAAGILSVIVVLFALAGIESYLRAFRRGRNRVTGYVGLLATGALLGASAAVSFTVALSRDREVSGVVGPAVLGSFAALMLGLATRANRKRRRAARQELRHTAIKALAKQ